MCFWLESCLIDGGELGGRGAVDALLPLLRRRGVHPAHLLLENGVLVLLDDPDSLPGLLAAAREPAGVFPLHGLGRGEEAEAGGRRRVGAVGAAPEALHSRAAPLVELDVAQHRARQLHRLGARVPDDHRRRHAQRVQRHHVRDVQLPLGAPQLNLQPQDR